MKTNIKHLVDTVVNNLQLSYLPNSYEIDQHRCEIERAIDGVKGGRRGYWPPRFSGHLRRRQRHVPGSLSPYRKREQHWGRKRTLNFVDESQRINVRGKVPRAFLRWLKAQTERDWAAREMLEKCLFEER